MNTEYNPHYDTKYEYMKIKTPFKQLVASAYNVANDIIYPPCVYLTLLQKSDLNESDYTFQLKYLKASLFITIWGVNTDTIKTDRNTSTLWYFCHDMLKIIDIDRNTEISKKYLQILSRSYPYELK